MSSRRYRVDQELEIYNFRVVPELQISKEVDFYDLYVFYFLFENKVVVQSQKFPILADFLLNLSPVRRRCNEIRYPRGF